MNLPLRRQMGCMVLFCAPFIAVGLGAAGWIVRDVWEWSDAQSWVEVPARIEQASLETHSGDTTTYSVGATYTYHYEGRQYTGNRVDLAGGSDNVGDHHQRIFASLERARARGGDHTVYVNPRDPAQALINRDLRTGLLMFKGVFAVVFGGAGIAVLALTLHAARRVRVIAERAQALPDEPWLHEPEFAEGVIPGEGARSLWAPWFFAVFWNAIAAPAAILAYLDGVYTRDPVSLVILLFPAVGLILLGTAIYLTAQVLKYGRSEFRPAHLPGVLGGALRGVVHVPRDLEPPDGFRLELSCVQRRTTGSGKNRRTIETVLWQDTRSIAAPARRDAHGTDIPVIFGIPYDAQPTDNSDSGNERLWRLSVRASMPGIDYSERFPVPVYRTAESDPNFVLDESVLAPFLAADQEDRDFAEARVHVLERTDGLEFRLPAPRHAGMATMVTVFGVVFGGMGAAIGIGADAPWIFVVVFSGIGALMLWWALLLWTSGWRVHVGRGALTVQGGPFALGKLRTVQAGEIQSMDADSNTAVGNQKLYNIVLTTTAGQKIALAKWLPNQRIAQRMIERIIAAL